MIFNYSMQQHKIERQRIRGAPGTGVSGSNTDCTTTYSYRTLGKILTQSVPVFPLALRGIIKVTTLRWLLRRLTELVFVKQLEQHLAHGKCYMQLLLNKTYHVPQVSRFLNKNYHVILMQKKIMLHCPSLQATFTYSFNTPVSYCTCHRTYKAVLPRHRRREQQRECLIWQQKGNQKGASHRRKGLKNGQKSGS